MLRNSVKSALMDAGVFLHAGAFVLVDGQFGSTGKGLAADLLEQYDVAIGGKVGTVTTNAAPNSGHTAVLENGVKVFTQQIPVFAACRGLRINRGEDVNGNVSVYLNGGAVIDTNYLDSEYYDYLAGPGGPLPLSIHNAAAMICGEVFDEFKSDSLDKIASTGKGTGQAMAAKVMRMPYVYENQQVEYAMMQRGAAVHRASEVILVETAQGFSLGPNSGFYPYVTSRECSVTQALADAGISPRKFAGAMMVLRTYPIRVGNTAQGNSGGWYPDQVETTWEAVGQEAELTSVTKRVRRVATFSEMQLQQAMMVNQPNVVLLNFAQYCNRAQLQDIIDMIYSAWADYTGLGFAECTLLLGYGPKASDVYTHLDFLYGATPDHE